MTNKRKMILIVDDEPDIASYLKLSLEDDGFEVVRVVNTITNR
jgi:DNA-binding response OmpR family regulator